MNMINLKNSEKKKSKLLMNTDSIKSFMLNQEPVKWSHYQRVGSCPIIERNQRQNIEVKLVKEDLLSDGVLSRGEGTDSWE